MAEFVRLFAFSVLVALCLPDRGLSFREDALQPDAVPESSAPPGKVWKQTGVKMHCDKGTRVKLGVVRNWRQCANAVKSSVNLCRTDQFYTDAGEIFERRSGKCKCVKRGAECGWLEASGTTRAHKFYELLDSKDMSYRNEHGVLLDPMRDGDVTQSVWRRTGENMHCSRETRVKLGNVLDWRQCAKMVEAWASLCRTDQFYTDAGEPHEGKSGKCKCVKRGQECGWLAASPMQRAHRFYELLRPDQRPYRDSLINHGCLQQRDCRPGPLGLALWRGDVILTMSATLSAEIIAWWTQWDMSHAMVVAQEFPGFSAADRVLGLHVKTIDAVGSGVRVLPFWNAIADDKKFRIYRPCGLYSHEPPPACGRPAVGKNGPMATSAQRRLDKMMAFLFRQVGREYDKMGLTGNIPGWAARHLGEVPIAMPRQMKPKDVDQELYICSSLAAQALKEARLLNADAMEMDMSSCTPRQLEQVLLAGHQEEEERIDPSKVYPSLSKFAWVGTKLADVGLRALTRALKGPVEVRPTAAPIHNIRNNEIIPWHVVGEKALAFHVAVDKLYCYSEEDLYPPQDDRIPFARVLMEGPLKITTPEGETRDGAGVHDAMLHAAGPSQPYLMKGDVVRAHHARTLLPHPPGAYNREQPHWWRGGVGNDWRLMMYNVVILEIDKVVHLASSEDPFSASASRYRGEGLAGPSRPCHCEGDKRFIVLTGEEVIEKQGDPRPFRPLLHYAAYGRWDWPPDRDRPLNQVGNRAGDCPRE